MVAWVAAPAAAQTTGLGNTGAPSPDQAPTPILVPAPPPVSTQDAIAGLSAVSPEDRKAAIRRLSEARDAVAVPALTAVLRQDPDAEVRRYAVVALANIGDARAVPSLSDAAAADPSPAVRQAATQAVAAFGVAVPAPAPAPAPAPVPSVAAIGVLETAGTSVQAGAATRLQFDADEPGVEISQVVGANQGVMMIDGRARPTLVPAIQSVCRTPCRIEVPNGSYTFAADGYSFELEAQGGSQAWFVDPGSPGGWWTGLVFTILGPLALIGGIGMIAAPDDPNVDQEFNSIFQWVLVGAGAAMLGGGIALLVTCGGSAEQRSVGDFALGPTAHLSSTLAARDAAATARAWGLQLVLQL